jgi:hypothetical protein
MVIGGQALLRYGEARLTKDIDITLGLFPNQAAVVLQVIDKLGFKILVDDVDNFLSKTFVLPVLDPQSSIRVDLIFALSEYEAGALLRCQPVDLNGVEVSFISPEDLIIHKVIAARPRDLEDVKNVLLKMKTLDLQMIRDWLQRYDAELGEDFESRFDMILESLTPL